MKLNKKTINTIAWWIPVRSWRDKLRDYLFKNHLYTEFKYASDGESMAHFAYWILQYSMINPKVIFEIGANYAQDAQALGNYFGLEGENIWVFEPHPDICKEIKKTYPKFNIFSNAVYNEEKEMTFNVVDIKTTNNTGISSLYKQYSTSENFKEVKVNAIRMDNFLQKHNITRIDFLKLDVEGCNWEVLDGFGDGIKIVKSIHIEAEHTPIWEGQKLYSEIKQKLEENDFEQVYFQRYYAQSDSLWVQKKYLKEEPRSPRKHLLSEECRELKDEYNLLALHAGYDHIHYLFSSLPKDYQAIVENGFIRSLTTWVDETAPSKYKAAVGFIFDEKAYYFNANEVSMLEEMLNDKNLTITNSQKQRARKCIDRIVQTHLTKYNHQPIITLNIGRKNVKKVLVVDQSYNDASIRCGRANDDTFVYMLKMAIEENPDADIIIKTHPDTIANKATRSGYYLDIKQENNIYLQTEPINPISSIKYVDKVYVCTTQLGFEALMCDKEVHVFGMPFYAGYGLTKDRQHHERRTNKRTLEEMFYITYILYSHYVNPDKESRCEIEDAMDYLLKLREEYFKEYEVINEKEIKK